jgi:Zn-dependent peptidase ImmA (M78 family)
VVLPFGGMGRYRIAPVDIERIAAQIGIRVRRAHLEGPLGVLAQRGQKTVAIIEAGLSPAQQRMALAHELAHALLGHTEHVLTAGCDHDATDEVAASRLGESILLPEELVEAWSYGAEEWEVESLAETFQVPKNVAVRRLVGMGLKVGNELVG